MVIYSFTGFRSIPCHHACGPTIIIKLGILQAGKMFYSFLILSISRLVALRFMQ